MESQYKHNEPMRQSSEQSGALRHSTATLALLVRQSFDIFNTYGKQADSLENIVKGFSRVLSGYDDDKITRAFDIWLNENSDMPTPSDIKKICHERVFTYAPPAKQKEPEAIADEEYVDVDDMVRQCREVLTKPNEAFPQTKAKKNEINYSHWDSMPKELQDEIKRGMKVLPAEQGKDRL